MARAGPPEGGRAGGWALVFHKGQSQVAKPQAAAICAGPQPRLKAAGRCCHALPGCSVVLSLKGRRRDALARFTLE